MSFSEKLAVFWKFWKDFLENVDKIVGTCKKLSINRSSHQRCSLKKLFSEISQNSQEKICARVSFLINLQAQACNFIKKETMALVFSCEFWEISKKTFFKEYRWTTA